MSLIELPSNTGKVIAVNPHHVTSVTPYESTMAGRVGLHPMCILRMSGGTTALYVCAWSIEVTLDALKEAKRADYHAFIAGYEAAATSEHVTYEDLRRCFDEWQGRKAVSHAS